MANGAEEMYMWSAAAIMYNVITNTAILVNYSCTRDVNGDNSNN